jgi:hypothetical protein
MLTADSILSYLGSWYRFLIKMVRKVPENYHDPGPEYCDTEGDEHYRWYEFVEDG